MPTTLAEIYRSQLPLDAPSLVDSDAPGWLVWRGIVDVVAPFVTRLPADVDDVARFADLDSGAAAQLLERLPHAQLADRQNGAPTLGALLRAAVAHPGVVELHGYLVGPGRSDERITAEGMVVRAWPDLWVARDHAAACDCEVLIDRVRRDLGITDFEEPPDEIRPAHRRASATEDTDAPAGWFLWWD